jgi:hypothetical protein
MEQQQHHGNQLPNKYEVAVYNERVRTALRTAERNKTGFSDQWAETRYIEVLAYNKEAAIAKISSRYPEHRGFVIEDVREIQQL